MEIIRTIFYEPTFNLLMFFYDIVGNLGVAILLLAVVSRLITLPLTRRQMKNAEKNKVFQKEVEAIKKKYKKNQEKQAQELAKVQAKYLPGQLGGCLNMILALILLIQVRNVIINLVDQGVHAFNTVAYSESQKLPEDSIKYDTAELESGVYTLDYKVVSNGYELNKTYHFALVDDENRDELTKQLDEKRGEISEEEKAENDSEERTSSISLYVEEFSEFKNDNPIILEDLDKISAYIRPPSNTKINYDKSEVALNGRKIEVDSLEISKGEPLNFSFLGADLSKVATDFGFSDISTVTPYVLIAISVGITQIFASKVQMGMNPMMAEAKKEKTEKKDTKAKSSKNKDKKEDDMDFGEILAQSSKQMTYIFPLITIVWSLGFFGAFFPTGVSLFWTGQNSFVIIQELITNKEKTKQSFLEYKTKFLDKINKTNDNTSNGKKRK